MNNTHYFLIGIKGAAMSNLAVMLKQQGYEVEGCDVDEEFITDDVLRRFEIKVRSGFDTGHLSTKTGCVVYSASHGGLSNPLIKQAEALKISIMSQAQLIEFLWKNHETRIAVSGCHGKTTTTSLLAHTLISLGEATSYLIGAPYFNKTCGGHLEKGSFFIVEADEYGVDPPRDKTPKFLHLKPTHIICNNIDYDHPDVYDSIEDTKKAFLTFFDSRKLYLCRDDKELSLLIPRLNPSRVRTFGFSEESDLGIRNYSETAKGATFEAVRDRVSLGFFTLNLFGKKNVSNAAGIILLLADLGFDVQLIKNALSQFTGVKRRQELLFEAQGTFLFDDYGHHPEEIKATIRAFRSHFKNKRLIVLFQPHTYSRTLALKKDFSDALSLADITLIAPIFASARERKTENTISSASLVSEAERNGHHHVKSFDSIPELLSELSRISKPDDLIVTMGAGDIYKLKDDIISILVRHTG